MSTRVKPGFVSALLMWLAYITSGVGWVQSRGKVGEHVTDAEYLAEPADGG
jgi:hypothetical protein